MELLIDTHIWLWLVFANPKLTKSNREIIEKTPDGQKAVSAMSVWEIAMLVHYKRLQLDHSPRVWIEKSCKELGLEVIPLNIDIALESYALPGEFHGDPADRMIVATARQKGLALITQDKAIMDYAKKGHVRIAR